MSSTPIATFDADAQTWRSASGGSEFERWPKAGAMRAGKVYPRAVHGCRSVENPDSLLPTPTRSFGVNARGWGISLSGRRRYSAAVQDNALRFGTRPPIALLEWLMGFPADHTNLSDAEPGSMSDINTLLPPVDQSSLAESWAPLIAGRLRASAENIIEAGRLLIEAKAACAHGEFLRLFNDHSNPVDGCLPFGRATAMRLMAIAGCPVISNVAHAQHLPTSWTTLYELTRLPEPDLIDAIESGRVTPELKRSDVRKLITDASDDDPQVEPEPSKALNLMDLIAKTRETIADLAEEFGDEHKATLINVLRQEARGIEGEQVATQDQSLNGVSIERIAEKLDVLMDEAIAAAGTKDELDQATYEIEMVLQVAEIAHRRAIGLLYEARR